MLAEGRWVKVAVDTTGIHLLPVEMLRSLGFNDLDRVIVAGYGSVERAHSLDTAPDDLPVLPVRRTSRGILFLAEGDMRLIPSEKDLTVHRNHYSRGSYYYIGERDGVRSPETAIDGSETTVGKSTGKHRLINTHLAIDHRDFIEERPFFHGLYSFTRNFADNSYTVGFHPEDQADGNARLYSAIAWYAPLNGASCHLTFSPGIEADVDEVTLKRNSAVTNTVYSVLDSSSTLSIDNPSEPFEVTYTRENDRITTYLALRTATLVYPRLNRSVSPHRILHIPALNVGDTVALSSLPVAAEVWDVTSPRSPRRLNVTRRDDNTSTGFVFPEVSDRCALIAFDPASTDIPQPRVVGEVACQSLHSMDDADMLIVTTGYTRQAAERLAEAHRSIQGLSVAVVDQQKIFEEFSSGAMHPNGLRAMVRMLRERPEPLRHLLLMGQGSSDTRHDLDKSDFEALVTYCTEDYSENGNQDKCSSPDFYFGITRAGNILPSLARTAIPADVSVGRVAVNNSADAESYVDKCIDYLSNPRRAGTLGHALLAACYGNNYQHVFAIEDIGVNSINRLMSGATLSRSYMDLFPLNSEYVSSQCREHFKTTLNMGPRAMIYLGHGEYNAFIYNSFTTGDHLVTTYGSLPVCIMGCCLVNDINLDRVSVGDKMITSNPGPICVIAPGSSVLLSYNVVFVRALSEMMFSDKAATLGDVYRLTSNSFMSLDTHYQRANNLCYNFTGDPALPSYTPTRTAVVSTLDDAPIAGDKSLPVFAPGHKVTLAGTINTSDGKVDTGFNGSLDLIIYDGPLSKLSFNHEKNSAHNDDCYTIDETVADRYTATVSDGHWTLSLTLPEVMHKGESNRLLLSAYSDAGITAAGSAAPFCIDPTLAASADTSVETDTDAPEAEIWLGSPDFVAGDEVDNSPMLHVSLNDSESGVYLGHAVPGSSPLVRLDGKSQPHIARLLASEPEGAASLDYRLSDLSDGRHLISITVCDRAGNRVYHEVPFTVVSSTPSSLSASATIARKEVSFDLKHQIDLMGDQTLVNSRLIIRDLAGNPVTTIESPDYPYTWDLLDSEGKPVADGTYRVSATLSSPPFYTATPEITVTVVR